MRLKLYRLPASLFARMALILLLGLLTTQLVSIWLQWGERSTVVMQARGQNFFDQIAETIRILEAQDPTQRGAALAVLQSANLQVTLINSDQISPNTPRGQIQTMIKTRVGSEREVRTDFSGGKHWAESGGMQQRGHPIRTLDVRLRDGQWIRIAAFNEFNTPALSKELIINLFITMLIVITVVMIAVRLVTQPLQHLANAADILGLNLDAPPLTEKGPTEMRLATQAFNRMQARIQRLVDERARALAAVSHDLRTPLTRLRLRAELVDDDNLRDQIVTDLDAMGTMIDTTLNYLRGLQESETVCPIDMNALLQSLAEDTTILGKNISVEGVAIAPYKGRLSALQRALQNLIDNAIKYGHSAHITIRDNPDTLCLIVEDEGSGIPITEIDHVSEPYYRPDASRNQDTGGVGLGLSIVKDVTLMHGGQLLLANRLQGGLSVTLILPRK